MSTGRKPTSLEARRARGESVSELPVIIGGRPSLDELQEAPPDLCTCHLGKRHAQWCAVIAWREVVPELVGSKLIDRADLGAVRSYCVHMSRAAAIREEIEWEHHDTCACPSDGPNPVARLGAPSPLAAVPARHVRGCRLGKRARRRTLREQFVSRSVRGFTSNPLLMQEREALREARMIGELLGLNPVGRTRLVGKQPKGRGLAALTTHLPRPALAKAAGEQ